MLHRVIFTAASVIALATAANAADLGSYKGGPASYAAVNWSGFYAGGHAGGQSSSEDFTNYNLDGTVATKGSLKDSGFIGGGQFGYNVQSGNLVFGAEIDLGDLSGSASKNTSSQGTAINNKTTGGFYGDVTGRIGYTFDKALVYAKGGYAFQSAEDKFSISQGGNNASSSVTGVSGWTLGAGVEYLVNPAWSVKAEYQHFEFGDVTTTLPAPAAGSAKFTNASLDAVTAGVNYHFGRGFDVLK